MSTTMNADQAEAVRATMKRELADTIEARVYLGVINGELAVQIERLSSQVKSLLDRNLGLERTIEEQRLALGGREKPTRPGKAD